METKNKLMNKLVVSGVVILLLLVGVYFFPWRFINWGSLTMGPARSVTVTGISQTQSKNQVATFTAGVSSIKDKKEDAVNEVNQKMDEIVKAVKGFGVKEADVKTQNNSIYQMQENYYEDNRQKTRPGQWSVNNNVEIVLREVDRAAALSDLLSKGGANNVNGPMFSLDADSTTYEASLVDQAIDDARTKAEAMAKKLGANLGPVLSIQEGYSQQSDYSMAFGRGGGGGGGVVAPGTSTVSKSVTVTFALQ